MNEKSFPMIAGLVALVLVVMLVISMSGKTQRSVQPAPESSAPVQAYRNVQAGGAVAQNVNLPIPVKATVTIKK